MTDLATCVKEEWFGDGVQTTATASSFLSLVAGKLRSALPKRKAG